MQATEELLDERAMSKLRWRCRRGLLENDLFIERFFDKYAATLTTPQADALGLLMARKSLDQVSAPLDRADVHEILNMLRKSP